MAVYTSVSHEEAGELLKEYGFRRLDTLVGIEEGILNTNYLVEGDRGRFIMRILEEERDLAEESKELSFLTDLNSKGFPCPKPLPTKKGENFIIHRGKPLSLFTFVEGEKPLIITKNEVEEIGRRLGDFHNYTKYKSIERKRKIDVNYFYDKIKGAPLKEILGLDYEPLMEYYNRCKEIDYSHLPWGIIHNDIFPDNVFFKDGRISGMIDFNDSMRGPFIFDLAIVINYWIRERVSCIKEQQQLIVDFLEAYERKRKLSTDEAALLDEAVLRSTLTFIFLRINKFYVEDNEGAVMEKKDYKPLMELLKYF